MQPIVTYLPDEGILHCSPAAYGESACQAHAAAMGNKMAMRPFARFLWTLVIVTFLINCLLLSSLPVHIQQGIFLKSIEH